MAASRISKGRITEVVKRFRWFPLASPEKYGGSYLKNAWSEAPEVSKITEKWYFIKGYNPSWYPRINLLIQFLILIF